MVFLLPLDVVHHDRNLRLADREATVSGLPCEGLGASVSFAHPFGRDGFDPLRYISERMCCAEADQEMNMVRHSSCGKQNSTLLAHDPSKAIVEVISKVRSDERQAVFRTEDDVIAELGIGIGHPA